MCFWFCLSGIQHILRSAKIIISVCYVKVVCATFHLEETSWKNTGTSEVGNSLAKQTSLPLFPTEEEAVFFLYLESRCFCFFFLHFRSWTCRKYGLWYSSIEEDAHWCEFILITPAVPFITLKADLSKKGVHESWLSDCLVVVMGRKKKKKEEANQVKRI